MEIDWNKLTSETNNYSLPVVGGTISGEEDNQPVPVPVELDGTAYADLDEIFASDYENKRLTKEQILNDRRFMNIIKNNLSARYTRGGTFTRAKRVGVALSGGDVGGIYGRDYANMDNERAFEIWQNYQRSFSAGQTVTVGNEIAYTMNANDDTKVKIFDICATMGMEYIKWTAGEKNLDITMKYYEQRIAILHNNYFNKDIIVDISPKNKSTQ